MEKDLHSLLTYSIIYTERNKGQKEYPMTSEKKEKKKFVVPVTWVVAAEVVIEAEREDEAMELANNVDLDCFENADYVQGSFDVDFGMIEEVQ